ncbi:cell division protein FtsL [Lactococcus termiticola]|uniref:Cell division protein FtsL n=1 Tax=Lactococcus termiticola TaxID=2169526 RepID=A0A2R5HIU9_9LACT|nr:cell division protein FtsL [Lactococcus termiticola]GBG96300.1 cell division protein FtsL [Lactococcus termiticola]
MAALPKEYFDIKTAAKKDSFYIDKNSVAPEVLATKFKKISSVEKFFYVTIAAVALVLSVSLLYIKAKTVEVQSNTVILNQTIAEKDAKDSEYDQQIQELTDNSKLLNPVQKAGLTINYSNVLKAEK